MSDDETRERVRQQIREQYGPHRLNPAPDGGCRNCPLAADDRIHGGER